MGTLYPDGLFAVASAALLFEVWLCVQRRSASAGSLLMMAVALPFAAFARPNGWVFLAPGNRHPLAGCTQPPMDVLFIYQWLGRRSFWRQQVAQIDHQETQFPWLPLKPLASCKAGDERTLGPLPHMNDPGYFKPKVSAATIEALTARAPLEKSSSTVTRPVGTCWFSTPTALTEHCRMQTSKPW